MNGTAARGLPDCTSRPARPDREVLIEMDRIVKVFKTPAGEYTALKDVTARFYRSEFVSIVGKSGSGKSTLVNMITGIDHPTSGTVCIGDTCVHDLSESDMSVWRGRNLGIVFQFFQLLPMLTLMENVLLPMDFSSQTPPGEREERALALLELVGLRDLADKLPAAVSGGQQQSAAIARALANDPPILIADEPTGNLDSRTAEAVFATFHELAAQGKTIIMVTHDSALARRTQRQMVIADGMLVPEVISQALPELSHRRMLWLAQHLQPLRIQNGEPLYRDGRGQAGAGFYIVQGGELCVRLRKGECWLGPGDYLSTLDLKIAGALVHEVRAGEDAPADLLFLEAPQFERWLTEAVSDRAYLEGRAAQRTAAWRAGSPLPAVGRGD